MLPLLLKHLEGHPATLVEFLLSAPALRTFASAHRCVIPAGGCRKCNQTPILDRDDKPDVARRTGSKISVLRVSDTVYVSLVASTHLSFPPSTCVASSEYQLPPGRIGLRF